MKAFPVTTRHLILNEANNHPSSLAVYRIQAQLNMLDASIFPLLPAQIPPASEDEVEKSETPIENPPGVVERRAKPLMLFHLRPARQLDASATFSLDNETYRNEAKVYLGLQEAVDKVILSFFHLASTA